MQSAQPEFDKQAFNCPHCAAYAHMQWGKLVVVYVNYMSTNLTQARCSHCNHDSIWISHDKASSQMIWPANLTAPLPHAQMPEAVRPEYDEARAVSAVSPRSAAALLRLVIQKLLIGLGLPGKNINDDIGRLVQRGLPEKIQQALDSVRVIGNNAVHPGVLSDDDLSNVANSLFFLVNFIVEQQIAQPRKVADLFDGLPANAHEQIAKRDGKNKP